MLGKEDSPSDGGDGGGSGMSEGWSCQVSGGRKTYWRSASWSSSRTMLPPLNPNNEKDCLDPNVNSSSNSSDNVQAKRVLSRSQQSFKARSCLPPLQPLSIGRRSLEEWPRAGSDDVGEWPLPSTPSGKNTNVGGERLKLDLSNIQGNAGRTGGLVRREKIAFFDKECSKVADHIYLGGAVVARDRDILKQNGITHILNCVGYVCPEYFKADFIYRTLWLQDSPSEDITSILYDVFDYFEDVREQNGRVFVHCCQGVSRSTSLVIAYLMWREGQSFDDAFQYVKAARGIADPNMGFACQLLQCQKRVHAFPLSPSSVVRMYRLAPHSPYDPLHLVPKMLNNPSPRALDSRGAFIIHIPSAIYVWIGIRCEPIMERDARGAVCQIVRYEKVQGPIIMIQEGEEPSYFWDAFSNLMPVIDKSSNGLDYVESSIMICAGQRKVDSYDVDFEIVQKATAGGFVPPFASSENEHETRVPARESSWSMLRRKFASGNMKDFVSVSKSGLSRIYPDSMFITIDHPAAKHLKSSENSVSQSSSSSLSSSSPSSSPPCPSPDSLTSDLRVNSNSSDSPTASALAASCSHLMPSTVSSFSNMSLSSKTYSHSISKTERYIDVNFSSRSSLQSCSASPENVFLSEGRKSSFKSLKQKTLNSGLPAKDNTSIYFPNEQGRNIISNNDDPISNSHSKEDIIQSQGAVCADNDGKTQIFSARLECNDGSASFKHHERRQAQCTSEEKDGTAVEGIAFVRQPLVCRWPSLEKVVTFAADNLDSESVFVFISPSASFGKVEGGIIYFWLGSSFSCDASGSPLKISKDLGRFEEIDWQQASAYVLSQTGLPKDTNIKIIKQNEEPPEFLKLLSSLGCHCD